MNLVLRRTVWLDGENRPDDYEVRHEGRTVGRIYRLRSTGRELWQWTQIDIRAPMYGPNGGVADTLDDAKKAFRCAWDAYGCARPGPGEARPASGAGRWSRRPRRAATTIFSVEHRSYSTLPRLITDQAS